MRAVMAEVPADFLQHRSRRGADIWDEMWEGVLHMPPAPNIEHQDFEYELEAWLRTHWACERGRRVYHGVNVSPVGGWPDDYRIPDLVLLAADCPAKNRGEWLEGPPTVVIEIHSPGDEALEKLPFYAKLGVPEVWIIDRDSRALEIYALRAGRQEPITPAPDGWLQSAATGIELRQQFRWQEDPMALNSTATGAQLPLQRDVKLAIQMTGNPASLRFLPDTMPISPNR
jgi:Uma2 family endonuclease